MKKYRVASATHAKTRIDVKHTQNGLKLNKKTVTPVKTVDNPFLTS